MWPETVILIENPTAMVGENNGRRRENLVQFCDGRGNEALPVAFNLAPASFPDFRRHPFSSSIIARKHFRNYEKLAHRTCCPGKWFQPNLRVKWLATRNDRMVGYVLKRGLSIKEGCHYLWLFTLFYFAFPIKLVPCVCDMACCAPHCVSVCGCGCCVWNVAQGKGKHSQFLRRRHFLRNSWISVFSSPVFFCFKLSLFFFVCDTTFEFIFSMHFHFKFPLRSHHKPGSDRKNRKRPNLETCTGSETLGRMFCRVCPSNLKLFSQKGAHLPQKNRKQQNAIPTGSLSKSSVIFQLKRNVKLSWKITSLSAHSNRHHHRIRFSSKTGKGQRDSWRELSEISDLHSTRFNV